MSIADAKWFQDKLLSRLLRYVQIETTSDRHGSSIPSTPGQWELINLLKKELQEIGLVNIHVSEWGHIVGRVPASPGREDAPIIGFMAHVDTAADVTAAHVQPQIHETYEGTPIVIGEGLILSPQDFPDLLRHSGDTIITTDGTTLLGADDKAGIAEIMTALHWLVDHPEWVHGPIEVIFTPDEETGLGMNLFPLDQVKARCCYTLDGAEEGSIEAECFNAYKATVTLKGHSIHSGTARGKLVNAVSMAGTFLSMLPRNESPEATDDRYGFYFPLEVDGSPEEASIVIYIRDFDLDQADRRVDVLKSIAKAVEGVYPSSVVSLDVNKQYSNMSQFLQKDPDVVELLKEAVRAAGVDPQLRIIRGGTDGARLSEKGVPTPNIFTGGHNYHSRLEWASLITMTRATHTIIHLARLWAEMSSFGEDRPGEPADSRHR